MYLHASSNFRPRPLQSPTDYRITILEGQLFAPFSGSFPKGVAAGVESLSNTPLKLRRSILTPPESSQAQGMWLEYDIPSSVKM